MGAAATAGGNWLWNAGSKAGSALKGDAISVSSPLPVQLPYCATLPVHLSHTDFADGLDYATLSCTFSISP